MRIIPGDICLARWVDYGTDLTPELLDFCRRDLGLDDPLYLQFFRFMYGIFTLDLGDSMWTQRPILEDIKNRIGLSSQLAIMAFLFTIILAVPLGTLAAIKQNLWIDYVIRFISIIGIAVPSFWLGILLIMFLLIISQKFTGNPWLPPIYYIPFLENPIGILSQLIWPMLAAGYRYASVVIRMTRSAVLEIIRHDYILVARSKGLQQRIIITRHILRNALPPVITIIGMEFSLFVGGLSVIEYVFNLNGVGKLLFESVLWGDYNMTQALTMLIVTIFVITNLLIDLINGWIDPRLRYT